MTFRLLSTGRQTLSVLPLTRTPGTARDVVSWARVPDAVGFRFTVLGKLSHTWDGASTSVKVAKGQPIIVEALLLGPVGDDPPVTPPVPSGVAAPVEPITRIKDADTLAVNLYQPPGRTLTDYIIDGTGDSAVMTQPNSTGNVLRRFKITRPCVLDNVPQAKHGVYCKSRGNVFEDFDMDATQSQGKANNGFSVRMGDNTFRRAKLRGFNFSIAYFEHDGQPGTVTFEDVDGDSTATDVCIWMDDSNEPPSPGLKQTFVFRRVHLSGGTLFVNCRAGSYIGAGLRFEGCTINGRALTLADIGPGFPRNKLTIV